jgi:hypothetical protein
MSLRRALALTLALALGACEACEGCEKPEADVIPSVRLGMSLRDVRDRFKPDAEGVWQTRVGTGDDTVLEWNARGTPSRIADVRFEFHLGMLVAVRAQLNESAAPGAGDEVTVSAKTVRHRAPLPGGGSSVTILARDCPTHREEAEGLVAKGRASGERRGH